MKNRTANKFCRFLKEEGAYAQFIKAFKEQKAIRNSWAHNCAYSSRFSSPDVDTLDAFCDSIYDKHTILSYAFVWDETPQKWQYWNDIALRWIKYIDRK